LKPDLPIPGHRAQSRRSTRRDATPSARSVRAAPPVGSKRTPDLTPGACRTGAIAAVGRGASDQGSGIVILNTVRPGWLSQSIAPWCCCT